MTERRNSRALIPELIADPLERAKAEAANGLLQYDAAMAIISDALSAIENGNRWRLRPSHITGLQRFALQGISSFAGNFRPSAVEIEKSMHEPPAAHLVHGLVEDLCDYVNSNWSKEPLHLAAFILWRLNWIHPFDDGNGRTSRIVAYSVLCIRLGNNLAGAPTIPELITRRRAAYFAALDAADLALRETGNFDVRQMQSLLASLLAEQLKTVIEIASGLSAEELKAILDGDAPPSAPCGPAEA